MVKSSPRATIEKRAEKKSLTILHVASIPLSEQTGMGRIAWNWRAAFEAQWHKFLHIGTKECPDALHPTLWGKVAKNYMLDKHIKPDVILAHEPASGYFIGLGVPVVVFSHGIEKRGWAAEAKYHFRNQTFKSLFMPEFIRFSASVKGLKKADRVMLSNEEDKDYLINVLKKSPEGISIFKNGYYEANIPQKKDPPQYKTLSFLFNASWLERKGKTMMIQAFDEVSKVFPNDWRLVLAGVRHEEADILKEFPKHLHPNVEVIPYFTQSEETALYERCEAFILPSYFEGQSLALTQAMASGLCCICADNCGQSDFIKHQENGLLFKTGDVQDLATQIKSILENKNLVATYAQNAKKRVAGYTWSNVSQEIVELCESLVLR